MDFHKHKFTEREKRVFHFFLLLIVVIDLAAIGHATMADWSFLVLALMVEVNL